MRISVTDAIGAVDALIGLIKKAFARGSKTVEIGDIGKRQALINAAIQQLRTIEEVNAEIQEAKEPEPPATP